MKSLIRQQFLDLTWDAADLNAAAEFWLRLYGITAGWYGYSLPPRHALEIHLSGFPQAEGEALGTELERRALDSGMRNPMVTFADLDTLVVSSGPLPPAEPPAGLGLPLLAGEAFEGLVAEFRFRVIGRKGWRYPNLDVTMVVVGEIRGGKLIVKAVWRSRRGWKEDEYYRCVPMEWEREWLEALDKFKRSGYVVPGFAAWTAPPSYEDNQRRKRWKLITTPFGRPRLRGLLIRCLVLAACTAGVVAVFLAIAQAQLQIKPRLIWLILPVALAAAVGWFFWTFVVTELKLLFSFKSQRAEFADHYEKPARYAILTPNETSAFEDDPAVRKYTADLKAEGFLVTGDVEPIGGGTVYRTFRAPDGVTYFVMICVRTQGDDPSTRHLVWYATVTFQAQTFFSGGGRVDSVNVAGAYGYLRYPPAPSVLLRVFPDVTDPLQLYWLHKEAADAFATEKGLTPRRHEQLEDYVRRQEAINDEERLYYHTRPYSWSDHLRWYLQLPRTEQHG
jgi:hypothetical protein